MAPPSLHTPAPWSLAGQVAQSPSGVWESVGVVEWPPELSQGLGASSPGDCLSFYPSQPVRPQHSLSRQGLAAQVVQGFLAAPFC